MESLFGDVSDTEDPTYLPPLPNQYMNQDKEDLITLQDLLGEDLQPNNDGVDCLLEKNIQLLREENKKQKESSEIANSALQEILNNMWKKVKPMKRWRKSNPESWAVNVAKRRRADGLPYKSRSNERPAKIPKDINCSECKYKCSDNFDMNARNEICRHYWQLDFVGRKNFILSHIEVNLPKRVLAVRNKREKRSTPKNASLQRMTQKYKFVKSFLRKLLT